MKVIIEFKKDFELKNRVIENVRDFKIDNEELQILFFEDKREKHNFIMIQKIRKEFIESYKITEF